MPEEFLPFLGVILLLTVTPGPDMILVLRNGLVAGMKGAWITGLGCCTGIAAYALAAALGIAALLQTSPRLFDAVRWIGAIYLAYLGIRAVMSTVRKSNTAPAEIGRARFEIPSGAAYRQGVISNLLNPKIALLFLTLIPQFVTATEPKMQTTAILAITFLAVAVVWWTLFAAGLKVIGPVLSNTRIRSWIERIAGVILIGLGARIVLGY
ncbi:LysE family translocator [Nocardia sp. 2YAB30]|uniref:LysE family translocator n=1 Tax=unclassified Nocardia TaxID=2637762 RepID=UPI003F958257